MSHCMAHEEFLTVLVKAALTLVAAAMCGTSGSAADDAVGATWKHPLVKQGKLESPLVEVTPFVFKNRLYRLDNWQKHWETPGSSDGVRSQEDEIRIRDVEADRIVSIPFIGHGLGMAFVWKDRVYVFAGNWGPANIRECNASDAEVCQWQGKTLVYYTGRDQHFAGDLQLAEYDGTPGELFQEFFAGVPVGTFSAGTTNSASSDRNGGDIDDAVAWLEKESRRMIRACRRTMEDGTAAFPPQVGIGYEAFWLRDYAYMIEGYIEGFSTEELRDACLVFVNAQRDDGACVDCVKYDGTPIYQPGYGSMGANPVADGSQFTVDVAWHTYQKLQDKALLGQIIDRLIKGMNAVPRNPETSLVHILSGSPRDRCPYGFTDTVCKQGDVLFSSLLFVQASRQLAELLGVVERADESRHWSDEAERVSAQIREVFWDPQFGLFRAATSTCREHDIWGSAFAVYLHVASQQQALTIARYFKAQYGEIVQKGQIRHLPGGVYWEQAGRRDHYQNGAFWATATGWFVYTLDLVDRRLADQTIIDLVHDFRQRGCLEWCFGETAQLPYYLASGTNPLAGIRKMRARRLP